MFRHRLTDEQWDRIADLFPEPKHTGRLLAGDKGYCAGWIDEYQLELGITPVIPSKENQDHDARPVTFNKAGRLLFRIDDWSIKKYQDEPNLIRTKG